MLYIVFQNIIYIIRYTSALLPWKTKLFLKTSKLIKYVQLKLELNSLSIKKIPENIPKINKYLNGVG